MPAFALGWFFAAAHMRLTRSSMLEVLGSEYVKLARLKGLPEALVIAKHAFKNALIPVLTLAGINLVIMVNVAVVVETVFAWPGIGRLLYEGIAFRDFPVVQATVLLGGRHDRGRQPAAWTSSTRSSTRASAMRGDATMNGSRTATLAAPSSPGGSLASGRAVSRASRRPSSCVIALVAIFANAHRPLQSRDRHARRPLPPAVLAGRAAATTHLLGTDHLGRDVLSRLIFGARVSMIVGFTAVIVAGVIGTTLGIISGYLGGWVDQVIMRVTDTWLALPALTFAIFLAAIVGPSEMNIIIILGRGLLDALRARHPRRGALAQGARLRAPGHRGGLLQAHDHAQAHPAQRAQLGHRAGHPHARAWSSSPRRRCRSSASGVPPPKPAWGLMLADGKKGLMAGYWWLTVLPGVLHHADGPLRQPPGRLAARQARSPAPPAC